MTDLDKLENAFSEVYAAKHAGYATFMLGLLYKSKSPVKLSLLFTQTHNFYSKSSLESIKETFIFFKNLGVMILNMKMDTAYVSLSMLGNKVVHLIEQKFVQNIELN